MMSDFSKVLKGTILKSTLRVADLELPSNPFDEKGPAIVPAVNEAQASQLHPHGRHNHVDLFITEQVRNVP